MAVGHEPISDAGLLLSSIFVAVAIIGIGILGGQSGSDQMAAVGTISSTPSIPAQGTTYPGTPSTPATPSTASQNCLEKIPNQATGAQEYKCKDGCIYYVSVHLGGGVDVHPVSSPGTKPGQVHFSDIFSGNHTAACNQTGTLQGSLAGISNAFNSYYYQNAGAFNVVNSPVAGEPTGATIPSSGGQSGLNANYAPGAITKEVLPGSVNSTQYSWNNLPTQAGTYQNSAGGLVSYTPGVNGQPGTYNFWSTENYNAAIGAPGNAGAVGGTGGGSTAGAQTLTQLPNGEIGTIQPPTLAQNTVSCTNGLCTNSNPSTAPNPFRTGQPISYNQNPTNLNLANIKTLNPDTGQSLTSGPAVGPPVISGSFLGSNPAQQTAGINPQGPVSVTSPFQSALPANLPIQAPLKTWADMQIVPTNNGTAASICTSYSWFWGCNTWARLPAYP